MRKSRWRVSFQVFNYTFLCFLSILCLLPMIHVLALSMSSNAAASAGIVRLWPVDFNMTSYQYVLEKEQFMRSFIISLKRVALGSSVNMLLTVLLAYPLSKETAKFKSRTWYAWFFVFTILFNGGLIPWYMTIKNTGLLGSIWALILPGAVAVFNIILLLNFFRGLPKELEESAFMDGAGSWTSLWRLIVPLSMPAIATISLFTIVYHWNSWFDGMILMNSPKDYPLSTYLQSILITFHSVSLNSQDMRNLSEISDRTTKAAQIFLGALPILMVYPFLQRYFIKGIVLGSVKE